MRQFMVDQLTTLERDNIDSYLKRTLKQGPLEGMYWLPLPQDLLAEAQQGHESCGPFYVAVDIDEETVRFEMLIRSQSNLHCSCIAYATPAQRDFVLQYVDTMLEEELIRA
jgi:hypothetical protein